MQLTSNLLSHPLPPLRGLRENLAEWLRPIPPGSSSVSLGQSEASERAHNLVGR